MKRGEIILLWVGGLWTAFSLINGRWVDCSRSGIDIVCATSFKPLAMAIAGLIVVFLVWVTIYHRAKKGG